jgi:hypothetical protein
MSAVLFSAVEMNRVKGVFPKREVVAYFRSEDGALCLAVGPEAKTDMEDGYYTIMLGNYFMGCDTAKKSDAETPAAPAAAPKSEWVYAGIAPEEFQAVVRFWREKHAAWAKARRIAAAKARAEAKKAAKKARKAGGK